MFALKEPQMRTGLNFLMVREKHRIRQADSRRVASTIGRTLAAALAAGAVTMLSACNGIDNPPGAGNNGGALSVQIVQPPPQYVQIGGAGIGLAATATNDKNNAGVAWTCAPVGSCGSFTPTTTGYQITTLYTPPSAPPAGNTQ